MSYFLDVLDSLGPLIAIVLFILFVNIYPRVKKVPPNTVIIIDRNSHFHKKKRHGYYYLNPKTDMVTTRISRNPIVENYSNTFITHDGVYYNVNYRFKYSAEDVEMVLSSLEDSRRSIYDVVNCAVETTIGSLTSREMDNSRYDIDIALFKQLEAMLEPFYIDVTQINMISRSKLSPDWGEKYLFRKHISNGDNPIKN